MSNSDNNKNGDDVGGGWW